MLPNTHSMVLLFTAIPSCLLLVQQVGALTTPQETVIKTLQDAAAATTSNNKPLIINKVNPVLSIILEGPSNFCSNNVVFLQKSMNNERVEGIDKIKKLAMGWDANFQSDLGINASINRVSTISRNVVRVDWNVTWVPPTSLWLEGLGKSMNSPEIIYVTYNHLAQKPSTFSWGAVLKLIGDAVTKRILRIPLACIEGNTELLFSEEGMEDEKINDYYDDDCSGSSKIIRFTEDLSYAEDLRRGVLQNRKCSQDLRLFLEVGRRILNNQQEWDDKVAITLPWQTVVGSNPLDIDEVEEGPIAGLVFVGVALFSVVAFAAIVAPELIGQPLFGPPNYILLPEDL